MHDVEVGVQVVERLCHIHRHLAPPAAGSGRQKACVVHASVFTEPRKAEEFGKQLAMLLLRQRQCSAMQPTSFWGWLRPAPTAHAHVAPAQAVPQLWALHGCPQAAPFHEFHRQHHHMPLQRANVKVQCSVAVFECGSAVAVWAVWQEQQAAAMLWVRAAAGAQPYTHS